MSASTGCPGPAARTGWSATSLLPKAQNVDRRESRPVPGGVGRMTVACLLVNTLRAACAIHGLPKPAV